MIGASDIGGFFSLMGANNGRDRNRHEADWRGDGI
jgi:hypothetical protein